MWILGLNAAPLLLNFRATFLPVALGMLALYLPRILSGKEKK